MNSEEAVLLCLCKRYGINNKLELAHLFGQLSVESGNFTVFIENLNYSADNLCQIFPHRFDQETALQYGRTPTHTANQEAIGNILYDNRMGNGPNEGYRYRGRGVIQLTGKDNYNAFQIWLRLNQLNYDIINAPNLVATDDLKYLVGIYFWLTNSIGPFAQEDNYAAVTKKINGGLIGLADRIRETNKYKLLFK